MGYTTNFIGHFDMTPGLSDNQIAYINAFCSSRRMGRRVEELGPDPLREAVGLPAGVEGEFYVADGKMGVIGYNKPPSTQPGLWCQWESTEDGLALKWDGGEKFYDYVKWLKYMITSFFAPWSVALNGSVKWQGEEGSDMGIIDVKDNVVTVRVAQITFVPREE